MNTKLRQCTSAESGGLDATYIVCRMEEAGATLLALPRGGYSPGLRVSRWDVLQQAADAYGWHTAKARPAVPSSACITRMDEAFEWLTLIPQERYVLRRILGARSLVSPITERHLYSWRKLGALLGADHKAVQRWHGQAIDIIVDALRALPVPIAHPRV